MTEFCIHGCGKIAVRLTKKSKQPVCFERNAMQCPAVASNMTKTRNTIDPESGKSNYQLANKKSAETLGKDWFRDNKLKHIEEQKQIIFEDGKNALQKQAEKAMQTMRNNIDNLGKNGLQRRAEKMAGNKGKSGHLISGRKSKASNLKLDENGLSGYERGILKRREKGLLIPDDLKTDWEVYRNIVNKLTNKNFEKYYWEINPNNIKRSKEFHLDHIYSAYDGFKNKINPEIIANWTNLRLIDCKSNISKGCRSDVTLEELLINCKKQI
jgi:hypothetical protein